MKPELVVKMIRKLTDPIKRAVQLTVGRCVLAAVTDSKGIQEVQVQLYAGEVREMERFQNYGFTSVPLPSAEGVCVFPGGNREHGICISIDDRTYRLKSLAAGSVALYDASGTKIVLSNDGQVEVNAAAEVTITSETLVNVNSNATVEVSGASAVNVSSDTKVAVDAPAIELGSGALESVLKGETFQATFNAHTHVGNLGVPTSPPSAPSLPADLSTVVKGA